MLTLIGHYTMYACMKTSHGIPINMYSFYVSVKIKVRRRKQNYSALTKLWRYILRQMSNEESEKHFVSGMAKAKGGQLIRRESHRNVFQMCKKTKD